jgi:hypothetical protein
MLSTIYVLVFLVVSFHLAFLSITYTENKFKYALRKGTIIYSRTRFSMGIGAYEYLILFALSRLSISQQGEFIIFSFFITTYNSKYYDTLIL